MDILFAIMLATVICKAIWDDTYCLVTGKTSPRQERIRKRIEDGKPSLTDIILDGLNTKVNGEKKPKTGEPSMWDTFSVFWKQWWNDAWTEAARQRREKHRAKVEDRINGGRGTGTAGPPAAPAEPEPPRPVRDIPEPADEPATPSTPREPEPVQPGPTPTPTPGPTPGQADQPTDPDPPTWIRAEVLEIEYEPTRSTPVQATAVVIRPEPVPPRAIGPGDRAALSGPASQNEPPRQNGSTATMTSTEISTAGATAAINRLASDDADPEATQQLGKDLLKLSSTVQQLFDERSAELARLGVGGRTQEILAAIHDLLDGLGVRARQLRTRGDIHGDLADHSDTVGDVNTGQYLMRGRTTLH